MKVKLPSGFTLIELLLALSLLLLLVSSLVGGLQFGRRVWERGLQDDANTEFESSVKAIGDQLGASFAMSLSADGQRPGIAFEGRADGARFVTSGDGMAQIGGPILTEIGMSQSGSEKSLEIWTQVFRVRTYATTSRSGMRRTSVLRHVTEFKLAYFGSDHAESEPSWRDVWTQAYQLPLIVSGRVATLRHGRRQSASFTVALPQR